MTRIFASLPFRVAARPLGVLESLHRSNKASRLEACPSDHFVPEPRSCTSASDMDSGDRESSETCLEVLMHPYTDAQFVKHDLHDVRSCHESGSWYSGNMTLFYFTIEH